MKVENTLAERIKQRFSGFLAMGDLFSGKAWQGYEVFHLPGDTISGNQLPDVSDRLVLGKNAERFFEYCIRNNNRYQLIAENIQLVQGKKTIGELDFLLFDSLREITLHVELVCKFYLYDPNAHPDEKGRWIGPNRRDSLLKKLNKLKDKQLPLLFNNESREVLKQHDLDVDKTLQMICFKASLYVPVQMQRMEFSLVNERCIRGCYIHFSDFNASAFGNTLFCLPQKQDWFIDPVNNLSWISFTEIEPIINKSMKERNSRLCWTKSGEGEVGELFIVWW